MADLRDIQARVKALASKRDQIIRDAGAEENKLEEAYGKLRELGIDGPETLTVEDLQAMSEKLQTELAQKVSDMETQVAKGEQLMTKYQELQGS